MESTFHKYEETWFAKNREIKHSTEVHGIHRRMEKPNTAQDSYAAHPGAAVPDWSRRAGGDEWIETHFILPLRRREN